LFAKTSLIIKLAHLWSALWAVDKLKANWRHAIRTSTNSNSIFVFFFSFNFDTVSEDRGEKALKRLYFSSQFRKSTRKRFMEFV
jgi:hypothetical protein